MNDFIRERVCFYNPVIQGSRSIYETVEYAKRFGARGVELLNFYDELKGASRKDMTAIGRYIQSLGLFIPCFSVGATIVGEGAKKDIEEIKRCAEVCSELEIPLLHHTIYMDFETPGIEKKAPEILPIGAEAALEINEYAARLGVKTVIEDQGFVFNGVKNYGQLMDLAGGKLGTVLDVANIMFASERAEDFGRKFADHIEHVHIKDYTVHYGDPPKTDKRVYTALKGEKLVGAEIGTGDVNFPEIARLLCDISYKGCLSMEFTAVKDDAEVARSLRFVSDTFSGLLNI